MCAISANLDHNNMPVMLVVVHVVVVVILNVPGETDGCMPRPDRYRLGRFDRSRGHIKRATLEEFLGEFKSLLFLLFG